MTPHRTLSLNAFARRLSEYFPILMREILRHENNYLTRGVITPPQLWALMYLTGQRDCCMHFLAMHLRVTLPSATGLVDRLMRQGLARRRRCKEDRRKVFVAATPKGRRIVTQILAQKRKGIARLFAALSAVERGRYLGLVEKMVKRLADQKGEVLS